MAPVLALGSASPPLVPGYIPVALLAGLEAAAVLVSVLLSARRRPGDRDALLLCAHCARLHKRTEAFARGADAVAVGALAFLVALPFVAAGYESGFTLASTVLGASAVVAVVAAAAEADFLVRAAAARLWPHLRWSAEPARVIGGGARWLGVVLALYLFQPGPGLASLFGGVGKRLVLDLASTWTISFAAALLALSAIVALLMRWVAPLVFDSQPITLAPRRDPHGTSA